ncbi:MAG: hypothetical protein J7M12_03275, partial [Candidatus Hydrogenedentes bacterium]|nr:hypothetical protein [Candidatus Hydrogenedentota bacterium]
VERLATESKAKKTVDTDERAVRRSLAVKVSPPPVPPAKPKPPGKPAHIEAVTVVPIEQPEDELPPPAIDAGSRPNRQAKTTQPAPQAVFVEVEQLDEMPFQIFNTYLVIPREDRLLLVDQHALHERLVFDELHALLTEQTPSLQRLLVPIPVELPPNQAAQLAERTDFLRRLGIEIENFGENTFLVTASCHMFNEQKIDDLVRRVASELCQGDLFRDEEQLWESMLVMSVSACRAAIKAGQPLSVDERRALLSGLKKLTPPYTCPHGRPIVTELTRDQIERSFRRT